MKKNIHSSFQISTSKLITLVFLLGFTLSSFFSFGQTVLISPTGVGGFESGNTFLLNGWTTVNDGTNKWMVGSPATPYAGTNSAFISNDNGITNAYTVTGAQVSYFYRDITIPAGETVITLSFQWKNNGESGSYDRPFVYTAPTTSTPVANSTSVTGSTDITGTTTYLVQQTTYQTATYTLPAALAGTTFRLIFGFKNDGSGGTQPPASIDNISLTSSCAGATTAAATLVMSSTATANWNTFSGATNYDLRYRIIGAPSWTTLLSLSGTNYNLSGLSPSSNYEYQVKANGSVCNSWSTSRTFTTLCAPISSFPATESFSATMPNCWSSSETVAGASYHWAPTTADASHGASAPQSGTNFMYLNVYNASTTYNTYNLTTCEYTLDATPKQVKYYYYLGTAGYQLTPAPLTLQISTNSGSTWADLYAHTSANSTFATTSTGGWYLNTIDLTSYTNQTVKFRFVSNSNYSSGYCDQGLDEFIVENVPSCNLPTALTSPTVGSTTATISWTAPVSAPGNGYEYYVSTSATAPTAGTTPTGTTAAGVVTKNLTGLSSSTTYYYWVRSNCDGTDKSSWAGSGTFSTTCVPISSLPFSESFENTYTDQTSVGGCWSRENIVGTDVWTINSSKTDYNRTPRTGSYNAYLKYGNTDWMYYAFNLTAGVSYRVSLYARQNATSGASMTVSYGNNADAVSMTNTIINETEISSGDYQLLTGDFIPATSGVYYIGILGKLTSAPWYLSIDDFILDYSPSCLEPTALTAPAMSSTTATISWTASTSLPANGYDFYYSTSATPAPIATTTPSGSTAAGITSANLSSLSANTTYYFWVRSNCNGTDKSSWAGFKSIYTGYCLPAPTSVDNSGITNVKFGQTLIVNNTTSTEPNNYGNYSAMIGDGSKSTDLNVSITYSTGYSYGTKIWVDWNNDLDFEDAGELVYTGLSDNPNPTTLAATFNIPAATPNGNYRMRIGGTDNDDGPNSPCYTGSYATFEDYTLSVTNAPSCISPSLLFADNITTSSATLHWTAPSPAPTIGYDYYYSTSATPAPIATTIPSGSTAAGTTTANLSSLTTSTAYHFWVRSNCDGVDKSSWSGPRSLFTGYCLPTSTSVDNLGITNVKFWQTLIVNNTTSTETNNYGDYTAMIGDGAKSTDLNVNITYSTGYTYGTKIWVDWNKDLDFEDAGELVYTGLSANPNPTTLVAIFNIPGTTPNGNYRMRIGGTDEDSGPNSPCYTGSYASFEDYTLSVTNPPSCIMPTLLFANNITTTSATLNWTAPSPAPINGYEYYISTNALPAPIASTSPSGTTAAGITNVDLSSLSASTKYYFWVRSNCSSGDFSTWTAQAMFTTSCGVITALPFTENFDALGTGSDAFPNCWTRPVTYSSGTIYPSAESGYFASSPNSLRFQSLTTTPTYAVTPVFGADIHNLMVSFSLKAESTTNSGVIEIGVMSDANDINTFELVQTITPASTSWIDYEVMFNTTTLSGANNHIAFRQISNSDYYYYWLDNVVVKLIPSCLTPSAITASAVTATNATISWTASASNPINGYEYEVRTSGAAGSGPAGLIASGTTAAGVLTNGVSGLTASTNYYVYVRAHCVGLDFSAWIGACQFTTPCGVFTPTYTEGFSTFIPNCWSQAEGLLATPTIITGTTSYWQEDGFANVGTTGAAKINIYGTSPSEWLISPSIDLGSSNNYQLELNLALTKYGSTIDAQTNGADDKFAIVISTDNGQTWNATQTLRLWDNVGSPHPYNNISKTGELVIIDLSAYAGIVKFGLYGESTISNADNDLFVDNFIVRPIPNCPQPTDLNVSNILFNQANLLWTANGSATAWDIQYGPHGFSLGSGTTFSAVNTNPYTLTGLSASTNYDFYVRSKCSASDYSYWTGPYAFSTPCAPLTTLPWTENFDALTVPTLPSCWYKENGDWVTTNNANNTYDADAFSGTQFLKESYSATNEYIWTLGFNLIGGAEYDFSFWWAGDNYAGWTGDVFFNSTQSSLGATQLGSSFVVPSTTTTKNYSQVVRTFTPSVSGTYYFAVRANATSSPWYLSLDDFNLKVSAHCNQPTALTVSNIADVSATVNWTAASPTPSNGYNFYCSNNSTPPNGSTIPTGSVAEGVTSGNITGLSAVHTYYVWVRSQCGPSSYSTWAGPIMFVTPDLSCVSSLNFTGSSVIPVLDGGIYYFDVCKNTTLTLKANGTPAHSGHTLTYKWQINAYNGLGPIDYTNNPLNYTISSASGQDGVLIIKDATTPCETRYPFRIRSSGNPTINTISATINGCAGNSTNITVGAAGSQIDVTPHSSTFTATMGSGATTFIPDGPSCTSRCYESTVSFTDFPIGSTITSAADLLYLKINLEHSFIGDVQISLVCPNGGSAIILQDYFKSNEGGLDNSTYLWPYKSGNTHLRIGFGNPRITDLNNPSSPCNNAASVNAPGSGWDYCWSNNTNYSYANGNAYVYEKLNMSSYTVEPKHRVNASDMENKSNFYHPFQNFSALVGCPLNGTWKVKVCDSWAKDNGWIFNWELALNPALMPSPWSYTADVESVDFSLGTNASTSIVTSSPLTYKLSPNPSLPSGLYNGTFTVHDEYGCSSTGNINYTVTGVPIVGGITNGDLVWTGYSNTNFDGSAGNWMRKTNTGYEISPVIPDVNTNVYVIDYCANNNPVVVNTNVSCKNLTIEAGKTLSMGNQTINVKGNWTNNGTFVPGTGLVIFNGTTNQSITPGSSPFNNFTVNKSSGLLFLNSNVTVNNGLTMNSGIVNTNGNILMLGTSITNKGSLTYTGGHIRGKLKRWFSANTNTATQGFFPMGNGTLYRGTAIEYKTVPSAGGSLTVMFNETPMTSQNSNLMAPIPLTGTCSQFLVSTFSYQGYWQVDPADGLTGGTYDITLYANGLAGVTNLCNLTAIKRVGAGNWSISGTHVEPAGSIANPILKRTGASGWSNWGIGGSNSNMLPVELLDFTAQCNTDRINLDWSTASEVNNNSFTIERSDDAQNWNIIGSLPGSGNSNTTKNYQFEDIAPLPNNSYYRLSQTDYDGQQEIFAPISINCRQTSEPQVFYYPNPIVSEMSIGFQNMEFDKAEITIYDVLGNKVLVQAISSQISDNIIKLDLSFLTVGVYTVRFSTDGYVNFHKIIKK